MSEADSEKRGADWPGDRSKTEKLAAMPSAREAKLPEKVRVWREKLRVKAKQEKRFRFYSLYGLASHPETLKAAWAQVQANDGAPGVDEVSIGQVEGKGVEKFLEELAKELREKSYRCQPVRRVYIRKANGKMRPLGIPTVRDRVVQSAVLLILEPIFEADFEECSFGFRPGRSAHQALDVIRARLKAGECMVYDADLEGYFDSIPHDKLLACVRMRVVDGPVLRLIMQWLKAPVIEKDARGKTTVNRNDRGTPQGGVISPLLANIYLHWFDRAFERANKLGQWAPATLVRYADDFVVLTRELSEELTGFIEEKIEGCLGLKINREKTRVIDLREEGQRLDFLGYSFRLEEDLHGRQRRYWNLSASKGALTRERQKLREMTDKRHCWQPLPMLIEQLNAHLRGWANYFALGYPRKSFRDLNCYVRLRLACHLRRRSQRAWQPPKDRTLYEHLAQLGLVEM